MFVLPFVLAWVTYSHRYTFHGQTNHGYLITPPFSVSAWMDPVSQAKTRGKWVMLYFYAHACDKECEQGLYEMRQIRTAMGGEQDRITRVILTYPAQATDPALTQLLKKPFLGTQHFVANPTADSLTSGVLYLVDPHGNVIMSYQPDTKPQGIFKDLQRLLKVSQIG